MKTRVLYIIALVVILLDQVTKYLVESRLEQGFSVRIVGRLLSFTALHNRGGAFGVLQSWTGLLTFVSLAVVVSILVFFRRKGVLPCYIGLGLALQLGGALGNGIDRLRLGYVVDFIDLGWWPIFNIADVAISVGIVLLAYYLLIHEGQSRVEALAPDQASDD